MSTTTKFTPGPLLARKGIEAGDEHRCGVFAVRDGAEYHVATIENGAPGDICETEFANAALFAASPALYAALDRLTPANVCTTNSNISDDFLVPVDFTMGELRAAWAALAKARGEA